MATMPSDSWRLLLYMSPPCVVIGKHQNPWVEAHPVRLAAHGVALARRVSGGGAVYHDAGNLCYSFVMGQDVYDRESVQRIVLDGIRSLGIPAELGERHILLVNGRKFSGNAFCYRRGKVLHHGTLLVRTDLKALERSLLPMETVRESRGIASVPSPVVNLSEISPGLTPEVVAEAVVASARRHLGDGEMVLPEAIPGAESLSEEIARHQSWDWLFGRTPAFEVAWKTPLGVLTLGIEHGRIAEVVATWKAGEDLCQLLAGQPFDHALLAGIVAYRYPALAAWIARRGEGAMVSNNPSPCKQPYETDIP